MPVCNRCNTSCAEGTRFCHACGTPMFGSTTGFAPPPPPPPTAPPLPTAYGVGAPTGREKQGLAIAGLVCGIIAFLLLPVVLGPLGIIFGAVSWRAGNKLGLTALIVSVIALPVGMLIGILAYS